jgi:hypothetical protein
MKSITITIRAHHLEENSWSHGVADLNRRCPLEEAFKEMGYSDAVVGGNSLIVGGITYHIDSKMQWNFDIAQPLIDRANEGENVSITLTFRECIKTMPMG